jgi:hypothetical protein
MKRSLALGASSLRMLSFFRPIIITILRLLRRFGRWVEPNINVDRWLAVISIIVGLVGIIASFSQALFIVATAFAMIIIIALYGALRAQYLATLEIHPFPYRIEDSTLTLDILEKDGTLAIIRYEETFVSLRDHLVAHRQLYWGDWDEPSLADIRCTAPPSASVADYYREGHQSVFLISLRHIYNYGEKFDYAVELTVKNGFCDTQQEYFERTVSAPINHHTMRIILPQGKRLKPQSVRVRVGSFGRYNEYQLGASYVAYAADGRQQISWPSDYLQEDWTYRLIWGWEDVP